MKNFEWIETSGGPLILLDSEVAEFWSGILERTSYLQGNGQLSTDFMDPLEADYGKACSINGYLGVVNIEKQSAIVFGDEPLPATIVHSSNHEATIAQWAYGENESEKALQMVDFPALNWNFNEVIKFNSAEQYLFDAAIDGRRLVAKGDGPIFLRMNLSPGEYQVLSTVYEPNSRTRFILYKLLKTT